MPAESFRPLLQIPGIQYYSLQIGPENGQGLPLAEAGLIDLTASITDFADTGAFVAELDLIITVDTSVAHLAGAMGRPVWLLLPFPAEWRWGVAGETTPWYPSTRLFRRGPTDDWDLIVRRIAVELDALKEQGKPDEAIASRRRALEQKPELAKAQNDLGINLLERGSLAEAVACFEQALSLAPDFAPAHSNLGVALKHQGKLEAAVACLRRAIELDPSFAGAYENLGLAFMDQGKPAEAAACARRALELNPDSADSSNSLGVALQHQGKLDEALGCFHRALDLNPSFAGAHFNLGHVYQAQEKLDQAIASHRRALELKPDFAEAHCTLGLALHALGKPAEAVACYRRALALKPDFAEALGNLSNALHELGNLDEAHDCVRRMLALKPGDSGAHFNLGQSLLLLGRYEQGWREYEHRFECLPIGTMRSKPRWDGKRTEGRTILIYNEQGFGDTLQFARYLPLVRQLSGAQRILFRCQRPLLRLFAQTPDFDAELIPDLQQEEAALPPFDFHLPLLSLPLTLGLYEPRSMDAYLSADPPMRQAWRDRLGAPTGIRVGLVWAGSGTNKGNRRRSMPAEQFRPLLQIPEMTFYTLQIGPENAQGQALADAGLIDLTEHITDFADTAAFLAELDLLITVDTAVAHLAGAMGQPVWLLLPSPAEWRWGVTSETTPWYPSMRLFRQNPGDNWDSVINRIADELKSVRSA
jgi:tetratricopeptide (TPR) repeat protein